MARGEAAPVPSGAGTWSAEDFRYYLLALAHNTREHDYSYAQRHFPKRIELSAAWHETFNRMRRITLEQGIETWCLVGVTCARDRVLLSQHFLYADVRYPLTIDESAIEATISKAARCGVPYCVVDIHSHPRLESRARQRLWEDEFSGRDLEGLLESTEPPAVKFLVGPARNAAVFRSLETELIDPLVYSHHDYALFLTGRHRRAANNRAIAARHRLVLYRGAPNQLLVRVFP